MKIIKINSYTLYFFFILLITGYIKIGIIIFLIIFIHEIGHVILIKLYKYRIIEVTFYPFGGITKVDKDINTSVNNELIIASGGIIAQLILMIFIVLLPISQNLKYLIYKYNLSILLFNMLPIIPLDGSNFVKSLLNKYFSFKNSYIIYIIISIISTIIYLFINYKYSLNNYMIIFLFIYKTYQYIKDFKYIYNRFLLERYLNEYSFKHINTRKGDIDILKLDTYQYFKENKTIIGEKEKLKSIFSKY